MIFFYYIAFNLKSNRTCSALLMAHLARLEFISLFIELLFVKHQQSVKLNFISATDIIFYIYIYSMLICSLTFGWTANAY